jgi:putative transposase
MCSHRSRSLAARAPRITRVLDRLHGMVGLPKTIVVDNGPEFAGRTLDAWAYKRGVELRFIRPGKPIENAYVESFNGKFRDECLNEHWFISLADATAAIEAWRVDYNTVRPHSSLAGRTPDQFAALSGARRLMPARPNKGLKPEDLALSV